MPTRTLNLPDGQILTYCERSKILTVKLNTYTIKATALASADTWKLTIGTTHPTGTLTINNHPTRLGEVRDLHTREELGNFITDCFQHAHSTSSKPLTF